MQIIKLRVDDRFGVEKTIRKFKRMCDNYGVVREYRNRSEYKKPSVKDKEKTEAAEKRRRKSAFKSLRSSRKI
jgi:small subunit ribosomal protein S21